MLPTTPPNLAAVQRILTTDPSWCAYALADLQPDFAPHCTWSVGADGEERAVALLFTGLDIPALFLTGSTAGVDDAVRRMRLPDELYVTIRAEHLPVVERLYDLSHDQRPMWRLVRSETASPTAPSTPGLVRLTVADSDRLRALYRHGGAFTPDAFSPYQIDNGVFYGVEDADGTLIAAGGTHIVNWDLGVGAIGNMYTRPDGRRAGHAATVLSAIVASLVAGGVGTIVLNVDQRNDDARRIYEKHGFVIYCPYLEGIGQRRK